MLRGDGPAPPLRPIGLGFFTAELEGAFRVDYDKRILGQIQCSLVCGAFLYILLGVQDIWFFPDHYGRVWVLRGVIVGVLLLCFGLSYHSTFAKWSSSALMFVALLAGAGPIVMIALGSQDVAASYYLGLVLVVVWIHTFSGLRFLNAVFCNLILFIAYLAMSLATGHLSLVWMLTNASNLAAASLLAGFAGYLIERQRRTLFYRAILLDAERRSQEHLAMSDYLTGLPNRSYFEQRIKEAMSRAEREGHCLALIFIDIDDFKKINDDYGHQVGDEVLAILARSMEETLRANDTLARLGGDEFVALLEDIGSRAVAEKVAKKLKAALSRAIVVETGGGDETLVRVSASAGIAVFPEDAADRLDLLRWADQAMYQDKRMRAGSVPAFTR